MPIKPENRKYYAGKTWKYFRAWALERAEDRCQFCGLLNYSVVDEDREMQHTTSHDTFKEANEAKVLMRRITRDCGLIVIVLTIAHLDHNPENNHPENLRALCQKCHLDYDRPHHMKNAAATRRKKWLK